MPDPIPTRRAPQWRVGAAASLRTAAALACVGAAMAHASVPQGADSVPASPGATTPQVAASQQYTDAQLKLLVGPVALYPDALLANTLTACMYPSQIAQAALICSSGAPSQAQIDATDWELPVKAIASVPSVVTLLNQHPDWTKALGAAYLKQPADVMRIVQQLRATALANGTLKSDAQQTVSTSSGDGTGSTITIVPTNPQVIYAPVYSPDVVYADPAVYAAGYPAGYWGYADGAYVAPGFAAINCDWNHGYCAWGNAVYNPAWDHVGLAGVNTLHNQWYQTQRRQDAAFAAAATPGGIGSPYRGVGAVGSPYRPAAAAAAVPGGVGGWPRMPDAAAIPGYGRVGGVGGPVGVGQVGGPGGVGSVGRPGGVGSVGGPAGVGQVGGPGGVGQVGGPGGVGSPGRPGGVGSVGGPAGVGTVGGPGGYGGYDRYGGERGAFYGDRGTGASSQRGAYSNQRSGNRGGYGGGGRR
jgi:hypothetical protein